jgi:hypothetical protein
MIKNGGEYDMSDKKKMPDFDSLSDRVIAEPTHAPIFSLKTNLDPETPEEENPYYSKETTNKEKLDAYFRNK